MKKILLPLTLISSLYATSPCEHQQQKVCIYLYKGALTYEINIINLSQKRALFEVDVSLDGRIKQYKDWIVKPNETITLMKTRYTDPQQKPSYGWSSMQYKFVD